MFLQRRILKIYMMKFNLFFEFVNFFLRDISYRPLISIVFTFFYNEKERALWMTSEYQ